MAGDLLQKLNISAQQQVRLQKPAQNQPVAAAPVQTPIKEKGLEYLPAVTITPAKTIPTGLKPQSPAGRLISENVFQSAGSTVKNYANCAKYFYDAAFKGEGTDYSVGKINDLTVRAGSLGIAGILAATKAFPFAKGMEFVGLATWFGSMALWPRIIGAPIKAKTGVDINWKYEDSYGRRKPFLQDPQYLAWDLFRHIDKNGKYNPKAPDYEYLNKIGDKLGVPRDIKNRNEAIQDKIRQVGIQGNALWMLTAGVMTPVISSIVADALQEPLSGGIESFRTSRAEKQVKGLEAKLDSVLKSAEPVKIEKLAESLGVTLDKEFTAGLEKLSKAALTPEESEKFIKFLEKELIGTDLIYAIKTEMNGSTLVQNVIRFDGAMQDAVVKAMEEKLSQIKAASFDTATEFLNTAIEKTLSTLDKKNIAYSDETKIGDLFTGLNIREKQKIRVSNINTLLRHYKDKTVGEFKQAIASKDKKFFGIDFIDRIKPLTRADVDRAVNIGNFDKRADGLVGFGQTHTFSQIFNKALENAKAALGGTQELDVEYIATMLRDTAAETAKKYEVSLLDVERAKKLITLAKIQQAVENQIDLLAKATIQDISEAVTANNWQKVPKKYFKAMGFTKAEIRELAAASTTKASEIMIEKFTSISKDSAKFEKVVKEIAKYADSAISKEEKALLNIIGTFENPGPLIKLKDTIQKAAKAEGFSNTITDTVEKHFSGTARELQSKVKNTTNSFGKLIKALDSFREIDEFVIRELGSNPEEFKKIIKTQLNKFYTFKGFKYEEAKSSLTMFLKRAFIENADINNWQTKFEAALDGNPRGIKHSKELLMDLNAFMYGDFSESCAKLLPDELAGKLSANSYEMGFRFMPMNNKLLLHVSGANTNRAWGYVEDMLGKYKNIPQMTEKEKAAFAHQIEVIEHMIEARKFELHINDLVNMKKGINKIKEGLTKFDKGFNPWDLKELFGRKLGQDRTANVILSEQTGKGITEFTADAARNFRSRNKWSKLVWGLFAGTTALSALVISQMGKKNYFNRDIYAKKEGLNANNK